MSGKTSLEIVSCGHFQSSVMEISGFDIHGCRQLLTIGRLDPSCIDYHSISSA